jgi:hypothetical protein
MKLTVTNSTKYFSHPCLILALQIVSFSFYLLDYVVNVSSPNRHLTNFYNVRHRLCKCVPNSTWHHMHAQSWVSLIKQVPLSRLFPSSQPPAPHWNKVINRIYTAVLLQLATSIKYLKCLYVTWLLGSNRQVNIFTTRNLYWILGCCGCWDVVLMGLSYIFTFAGNASAAFCSKLFYKMHTFFNIMEDKARAYLWRKEQDRYLQQ